ncbi:MAG: hypothetical protein ACFFCS_12585 [Candidatus Hodarchaeota archaeon]
MGGKKQTKLFIYSILSYSWSGENIMDWEASIEEKHLIFKLSGSLDMEKIPSIMKEMLSRCEDQGKKKVLCDIRNLDISDMDTLDKVIIGKNVAEFFGMKLKIAAILPEDHKILVGDIIARERGGDLKGFFSKKEALKWLA